MFKRFLLAASVLCLSSCAYVMDQQIQDITIVTPGAEDTVCYAYIDGLRYKVHPPETVNVSKSAQNLVVDCLAPGNRRRKVVIEPSLSKHEKWNVANAGVGAVWDVAANAAFEFPSVIEVDFTSAQVSPEPLPAQNNPDIKQPEEYDLEEFLPSLPRLNSDRGAVATPLQRRQHGAPDGAPAYTEGGITPHEGPGKPADKGDLGSVVDGLTTKSAPAETVIKPESDPNLIPSAPAASESVPAEPAGSEKPGDTGGVVINPMPLKPGAASKTESTTPAANPPGAKQGAPAATSTTKAHGLTTPHAAKSDSDPIKLSPD